MNIRKPPLQRPLSSLASWAGWFRDAEIPVLATTAEAIEAMRANEDEVDANALGEVIGADPLMTIKVLAHAGAHRHSRLVTDAETVTAALLMMGIGPFFRAFEPQPTVEQRLADQPAALEGLNRVLHRAERAARFALGFAVHRMDQDTAAIHTAALLHDFVELLLWCHAPTLALALHARQVADPTLRSRDAQRAELGIELSELEHMLMKTWRLPELLVRMTDDRHARDPRVRTVMLALQVARHTTRGWNNAALPDDVAAIAELLNLAPTPTLSLLRDLDC